MGLCLRAAPRGLRAAAPQVGHVVPSGEPIEDEARLRRADGAYRWFLHRAVPLRDGQGRIVRWYGTSFDIQDHKRAQRALRRTRERAMKARFTAALDERSRLAREIHDTLLQGFTGIALKLVAATGKVAGPPETVTALRDVIALAQKTLVDARRAVWDLALPSSPGADFVHGAAEGHGGFHAWHRSRARVHDGGRSSTAGPRDRGRLPSGGAGGDHQCREARRRNHRAGTGGVRRAARAPVGDG